MRVCPQCSVEIDDGHKFCPACGFPIGKVAQNADDPLVGRTLPGGYVILELVGIGGMGRVYRAEQTNLGRTVAVKIIHPHLVGEENAAARFITEARAASRLNHPNSVAVIDFGKTSDGQLYLVMEFLRGRDLARVQYEEGPLAFRRIVSIVRQVLAALSEAHHLGIIHRDLKPENVILEPVRTGGDFVKVVDFGLAKMRAETAAPSITSPGIVCGTPEYMSPEQGRGDPLDPRSDLYAVGVIFYLLLVGKLPFEGDSPTQVVLSHISQPPPDPREMAPDRRIPESFSTIVLKALAKRPDDRYVDADAFGDALSDALGELEGSASHRVAPVSQTRCPACGTMNPSIQKFCGECGTATTSSAPPPRLKSGASTKIVMPPGVAPAADTAGAADRAVGSSPPRSLVVDSERLRFPLPLMGREEDLAWLDDRRSDATGTLLGARIVGDAGIGKTRLIREFLLIASAAGDTVVVTGPDPAWAEVGYFAARLAVERLAKLPPRGGTERDWASATAEARRGLAELFHGDRANASAARLTADDRRYMIAAALRWAIVRASELSPGHRVVLAVDDLHAVDGGSLNAFADLISEPPLVPALLVVAYPLGFDPGWPANTAAARVLGGLAPSAVAKILETNGSSGMPPLEGRGVVPLVLEQLLRFTREQGAGAPTRLADLIARRVERLAPDARRVLQAVAVFGDETTPSDVARLLRDRTDVATAIGVLLDAGMVDHVEAPIGTRSASAAAGIPVPTGDAIRTAHPLLRDVVLATIPAAVRRALHAAAAEVCEEAEAPLEVRAIHELYAQNAFQALFLLERVGARCAARGDSKGNIGALRRALELARRELFRGELDDPMRAVLIFSRKLGEALSEVGDFTDAEGVLREALDMASDGADRAHLLGTLAHVAHVRDRHAEAQGYLREALQLATQSGARELVTSLEELKRAIA